MPIGCFNSLLSLLRISSSYKDVRKVNMGSFFRMLAVNNADLFAIYVLEVMVTYLTNDWNLSLTRATAIINIFVGARDMLLVGMVFIVDTFLGYHHVFLISAILNCLGMILLSLSSAPILSKEISDTQKGLYYTALPLLAIGYAGHAASYQRSLESQIDREITYEDLWKNIYTGLKIMAVIICDYRLIIKSYKFIGGVATYLLSHVGGFAIQFVKSWALRFGIATIFVTVATLLYLTGIASYRKGTPRGSPLTTFFRVVVASCSKNSYTLSPDANQLYHENVLPSIPHTDRLRCLDRAAIIVPNSTLEEQKLNRWKLCSVTEVEEAKVFFFMLPLWINFAMCGVVTSIGGTYFMEQGNQMNPYLGKLKLPLFTLVVFHKLGETLFSFICGMVRDKVRENRRKYVAPIGMAVAMLCSILCCITAAAVERRRLDVVKRYELVEKTKDKSTIPMTMFWLIPQYVFLSALNGISSYCSTRFFNDQAPESVSNYLVDITLGVTGAGIMGSVVTVYAVGKVSEIGGNPSWFQDTINKSRLDNYYWSLASLSSINLVLYALLALKFLYRNSTKSEMEPPEEGTVTEDTKCLDCFN
ncbi:Protein NRT1/ PTR FAMILY 5.5, partial [Mucuna pruriens]